MNSFTLAAPVLHQSRSLELRLISPENALFLWQKMYANPDFMRLYRLNDLASTPEELKERLAQQSQIPISKRDHIELFITHKKHGFIGITTLVNRSPKHYRIEFLIGLFEQPHRHLGYGLEVGLLLGDLIFNHLKFHRLYAYSYGYNDYAQKSLISGGFTHEGTLKEHVFDQAIQQFVDLHVYGMTLDQFRANQRIVPLSQRLIGRDITQPLSNHITPIELFKKERPTFAKSGAFPLKIYA